MKRAEKPLELTMPMRSWSFFQTMGGVNGASFFFPILKVGTVSREPWKRKLQVV